MTTAYRRLHRFALLASALCVAGALTTGCGKKSAPAASKPTSTQADNNNKAPVALANEATAASAKTVKQKVVLWHAYRDAERKALDALITAWNDKRKDIELVALAVPFDALIDKAQVAIPRGNGPDLLIFAHDKIGTWARDGLIQPLGKWANSARLGRFLPQTVKPLVFERAIYGLPLTFKSIVLFFNRAMVTKAPTTLKDLVTEAKKHTNIAEGEFGFAYDAADLYFHAPFLHAFGGQVFDESSRKLVIDSPEAVAAVQRVRQLHAVDKVLPKGMSSFVITAMFNDGKVPFVLNGPWFISEIERSVKWGVAVLPKTATGQPLKPFLGSEALMLSAKTKVREAALLVSDYLTSDEAALTRLKNGKQMVANKKIYENPRWSADPTIRVFRAQADNAVPMSNAVEAGLAWQPYNNALRKVIFGGKDTKKALKTAQNQANAAMAKLKR